MRKARCWKLKLYTILYRVFIWYYTHNNHYQCHTSPMQPVLWWLENLQIYPRRLIMQLRVTQDTLFGACMVVVMLALRFQFQSAICEEAVLWSICIKVGLYIVWLVTFYNATQFYSSSSWVENRQGGIFGLVGYFAYNSPCLVILGMPRNWPWMAQYRKLFNQPCTPTPSMHPKLTEHGKSCMQINRFPTKSSKM